MTIITVTAPEGRLSTEQRKRLAETLTDAVLVPEVGQLATAARIGFQVHFIELALDRIAIGGSLLVEALLPTPDIMTIDVTVMNAAWPADVRSNVIEAVLQALADACGMPEPSPTWWVTFRIVDEGSWGSRGGVLSILQLLNTGVFSPARAQAIRSSIS